MSLPEINNSRLEQYLSKLARGEGDIPAVPQSRAEQYLDYLCRNGSLPAVTDADNGSRLEVVRGKWAVVNDDYFCVTVNSDLASVTTVSIGLDYDGWNEEENEKTEFPNLEYSIDKKEWIALAEEDEITVNKGTPVYFRGINDAFGGPNDNYCFVFGSDIEDQIVNTKLSGNIMSLINGAPAGTDIPKEYCFENLFWNETITDISELKLPAVNLKPHCYSGTFGGTRIVDIPSKFLQAEVMAENCYEYMFSECPYLVSAPELPATTLAEYCYSYMFSFCPSLVNAPELPATTLAEYCYELMFSECSSLVNAPELPATTLAEGCYSHMFSFCTSLVNAPELPATTLAAYCYSGMFSGCTSLNSDDNPITLPAIELVEGCYQRMFVECSSLHRFDIYFKNFVFPDDDWTSPTLEWFYRCATMASVRYASYFDGRWTNTANGIPGGWSVSELPA